MANLIDTVKALNVSMTYQGQKLSRRDADHFAYSYKIFILVCLELSYYQPISPKKIIGCMMGNTSIDRLVRCQDHLLSVIRELVPVNESVVEEAGLGFILPTVRAFTRRHRIRYFRTINTVAQFLSKLMIKDTQTAAADLLAFKEFQEHPIDFDRDLVDGISASLPSFEVTDDSRWKFGPGASYEVSRHAGSAPKYRILSEAPCSYTTYRLLARLGYKHWTRPEFTTLISRAIAVPKNIKKRRIITVEKTFNTMATQVLRLHLLRYLKKTGFNVAIDDQSFNRQLALMGSANGQMVTIDLSSASDSVTIQLVRRLFHRTGLMPYLEDARAKLCEIEGQMVTLQTYAGMGNAVTFVLESIIFAAVVEYVAKRHQPNRKKLYSVYGDDIVVHRSLFGPVVDALTRLGFKVNKEKTYGGDHPFRESCGIEALGGHNVTPCRISRKTYFDNSNESVNSLLAVSNNLYDYGLHKAASAIRQWFRLKDRGLPYVSSSDEYGMLIWGDPDNIHLKSRYNKDLQRIEVRVRDFSPRTTTGNDDCRYQAWLMRRWQSRDKILRNKPDDGLPDIVEPIQVGPPLAMPRWRWTTSGL